MLYFHNWPPCYLATVKVNVVEKRNTKMIEQKREAADEVVKVQRRVNK